MHNIIHVGWRVPPEEPKYWILVLIQKLKLHSITKDYTHYYFRWKDRPPVLLKWQIDANFQTTDFYDRKMATKSYSFSVFSGVEYLGIEVWLCLGAVVNLLVFHTVSHSEQSFERNVQQLQTCPVFMVAASHRLQLVIVWTKQISHLLWTC